MLCLPQHQYTIVENGQTNSVPCTSDIERMENFSTTDENENFSRMTIERI